MTAIMILFEIVLMVFFAFCYANLPVWAKVLFMLVWCAIHLIEYASEDILRDKIKRLENEVKNLKKGGED